MLSTSYARSASLIILVTACLGFMSTTVKAQSAILSGSTATTATFSFDNVPPAGLGGTIIITVNGVAHEFSFYVYPLGDKKVSLPAGTHDDPDATWQVIAASGTELGSGSM